MKRKIVLALVLVTGFFMPYLSRLPLASKYGSEWVWKFTPDPQAFLTLGFVFAMSLLPLVLFGVGYIYGKFEWGFYLAVVTHFIATSFFYFSFLENGRDEPLALVFFPAFIAFLSLVAGLVGVVFGLLLKRFAPGPAV